MFFIVLFFLSSQAVIAATDCIFIIIAFYNYTIFGILFLQPLLNKTLLHIFSKSVNFAT